MTHTSISFLTLTAPEAVDLIGSFRTIEHLPETMAEGVIDIMETIMSLLPAAAETYHALQDSMHLGEDFNHVQEAYRVLAPALQEATFPLDTAYGDFDLDSPLTLALAPHNAITLLRDLISEASMNDREFDAVASMVDRMLERFPFAKVVFDTLLDDPSSGFDYVADAHRLLSEQMRADNPQSIMAA